MQKDHTHREHSVDSQIGYSPRGPLILGIIIVLVGIYFLLERSGILPPARDSWPVIVIVVGFGLIIGYLLNLRPRTR